MGLQRVLSDIIKRLSRHDKSIADISRNVVHAPFMAGNASLQTIAAGVISVTKPHVVVLPESGTADNLDEIENFADGKFIVISTADVGDTITVRDESISGGNIALRGVTSRVLSDPEDSLLLIYKESVGFWIQAGGTPAGGAPSAHASTHQHGGSDEVATATPAANAIPKAGGAGTLALGWIPAGGTPGAHATTHQHGGSDEVATATPAANAIVKAGAASRIANGWLDATLESLAALGTVADRIAYTTGVDTWAEAPLTAFVRTILDDANQAAVQATLALVPGTNVQVQDAELQAIAGLTSAADRLPYFTGSGTASLAIFTAFARTILDDADQAAVRTTLALTPGTDVQAFDVELAAIAGLVSAADRLPYFTGSGTASLATFTAFARTFLDDADAATVRTTLGLVIGTNVQAQDAELQAIAGLTSAADRLPYFTGSGTASLATFTAYGRILVALADAAALRANINVEDGADVTDLANVGAAVVAASDGGAPVDTDEFAVNRAGTLTTLLWSGLKTALTTLFDGLYVALVGNQLIEGIKTFTSATSGRLDIEGQTSLADLNFWSYRTSTATHGRLVSRAAYGTKASPSAILNAAELFSIGIQGYHSGGAFGTNNNLVAWVAAEDFTPTNQGVDLQLYTVAPGATVRGLRATLSSVLFNFLVNIATPQVTTPIVQATATTLTLNGAGGEFGAKVLTAGGFTRLTNSGRGDVLFETMAVPAATPAFQIQVTRATATTNARGFWAKLYVVGRITTVDHGCELSFYVQGRDNQTIVYSLGATNLNVTVTVVTQTSTNLTLKFKLTSVANGSTWSELSTAIVAQCPVHANWTITGSQVA